MGRSSKRRRLRYQEESLYNTDQSNFREEKLGQRLPTGTQEGSSAHSEGKKSLGLRSGPHSAATKTSAQTADHVQPLYIPLTERYVIRLVELAPGTPNDAVVLRLFISELGHTPEYEAVSYVWGSPENRVPILCNGKRLDVTANLNAAFRQVRYSDRPRILWTDAVCINQGNLRERSHQVSFMGKIYRHAKRVLVCLGQDEDGGAEDVAALVKENTDLMSKYESISGMPILARNDPLFDDPRWKALGTMLKKPWFTRAWVLQEAGLAKDSRVLYDKAEFSYRDLMRLNVWMERCAPNLKARASVSFEVVHGSWLDWSPDWQRTSPHPNETFLDLLGQAQFLACQDRRDHVYAFLGHPLAQVENEDGTIVTPDYSKPVSEVYLELARQLIRRYGLRVLSAVEHNDQDLRGEFPTWVPFYSVAEDTACRFGLNPAFYYNATAGWEWHPPVGTEKNYLEVRGAMVDVVSQVYLFTDSDLEDMAAPKPRQSETPREATFDQIWTDIWNPGNACAYAEENRLISLSLTLCAGMYTYDAAEDNLDQHRDNFAAYWKLRYKEASLLGRFPAEILEHAENGDEERCWLDMTMVCTGRTFLLTQNGYYGLGSCMAKPGDICCILFGATVPFLLRKTDKEGHYKLVAEAYIHGIMRGEAISMLQKGELHEQMYILC